MNKALTQEIENLGGDITAPVWQWLLKGGPHGTSFTWSQTRQEPPGYVGVEHLERIVDEQASLDHSFTERTKSAVALALTSTNTEILRRAIQVAAVLGGEAELRAVNALKKIDNESVAADARASVFHLKKRLKAVSA